MNEIDGYFIANDNILENILNKTERFELDIPENVDTIGEFSCSCSNITNINFSNIKTICKGAFLNCYNLTKLVLPSSVTSIGDKAFKNCPNLELVILNNSIKHIGEYAFEGSKKLVIVYMGSKQDFEKIDIAENNDFLYDIINFTNNNSENNNSLRNSLLTTNKVYDYDNYIYVSSRLRLINMESSLYNDLNCGDKLNPEKLFNYASLSNTTHGYLVPSKKGKPFFTGNPFNYENFLQSIFSVEVIGKQQIKNKKPFVFVKVVSKIPKNFDISSFDNNINMPFFDVNYHKKTHSFTFKNIGFLTKIIENYMPIPLGTITLDCCLKFDKKCTEKIRAIPLEKLIISNSTMYNCKDTYSIFDLHFDNIKIKELNREIKDDLLNIFVHIDTGIKMLIDYTCHVQMPTYCSTIIED